MILLSRGTQARVLAFEIRLHIVLNEKWWNLIQEILFHLFKKYLFTCLLVDCPLEPIAQQHHPKQAPFQKRVFTLSMFSLLKIGCVVTTYLSFLQILGVFKQKEEFQFVNLSNHLARLRSVKFSSCHMKHLELTQTSNQEIKIIRTMSTSALKLSRGFFVCCILNPAVWS